MTQKKKIPEGKMFSATQVGKLVTAAQGAMGTLDTLRREGTSFSREAYVRGYEALRDALCEFDFITKLRT